MIHLNDQQEHIVKLALDWYRHSSDQIFSIVGCAGTGKTTVLRAIIDRLKIPMYKVAPMTYIGAASLVLRSRGFLNAKTIHSWLYRPVDDIVIDNNGLVTIDTYYDRPIKQTKFVKKPLDSSIELIVIDEAASVPKLLKSTIESYGIKIICLGDTAQLPPVVDEPAYLYSGTVHRLTEIMRQAKDSPIVYLSQRAMNNLPIHLGYYGHHVWVCSKTELTKEFILAADMILCAKNYTRDILNNLIRKDYMGIQSTLPIYGDKIVCRKNNWHIEHNGINLANGLVGNVTNNPDPSGFDGRCFLLDFQPYMLQSSIRNIPCDYKYFTSNSEIRKFLKEDHYSGEKFELAYAITTHMSQGSEYRKGIYFEEYLNPDINHKLNYTGITRFSNSLIYVKQDRRLY